ncbi:MAG: gamma-glutamyltransferase [Anaerolineae bacterium]|nr:gamma-glutamyltransferase [Anaerolineae bacterium]
MKPMSFDFHSRRSMVAARRGMVAASNPLAAQAGLNILRQGGNAADAAIATAAVLNVTAPASTGVGGDCFALFFDAATGQVTALNGSGRAPAALRLEDLRAEGWDEIPTDSPHAVTVPGAVMGWHDLLARHGSMALADVLVDAIHYARDGFPVSPVFGAAWQNAEAWLRTRPNTDDYPPRRARAPGRPGGAPAGAGAHAPGHRRGRPGGLLHRPGRRRDCRHAARTRRRDDA